MKRIKSLNLLLPILLSAHVMVTSSCNKMLDTKAYSSFTDDNFLTPKASVDEAQMAVMGIYEAPATQDGYGWNISLVFDYDNDNSQMFGNGIDNWRVIGHYIGLPETDMYYQAWSVLYKGIDRANDVIEKIPQMDRYTNGTANEKANLNRLIGEAKFLRGFYYSELIRFWGDVPFKITSSKAGENLRGGLVDRYTIFAQVIKDMQEAIELLPTAVPTDERVNKWSAKAMLARVALYAGGYSLQVDGAMKRPANYKDYYLLAQQQINDIMVANPYKLNPSYPQVFVNQCKHVLEPTESIFEIGFYTTTGTGARASRIGNFNSVNGAGSARCNVLRPFYESFAANDIRRDFSIGRYRVNYVASSSSYTRDYAPVNDRNWTAAKWSMEYMKAVNGDQSYGATNYVVMRYADLLLMRAEIENELNNGPNDIALDAINQVRRRAYGLDMPGNSLSLTLTDGGSGYTAAPTIQISGGGGSYAAASATRNSSGKVSAITLLNPGYNYTTVPTVTVTGGGGKDAVVTASLAPKPTTEQVYVAKGKNKDEFFNIIVEERSKELCFEGMRRADLIRWNLLGTKLNQASEMMKKLGTNYTYPAGTNFVAGKHELFPFPQNETDVNKTIARQNPGW